MRSVLPQVVSRLWILCTEFIDLDTILTDLSLLVLPIIVFMATLHEGIDLCPEILQTFYVLFFTTNGSSLSAAMFRDCCTSLL